MRNEALIAAAGVLFLVLCCAGPILLAGVGAAVVLAALRAHAAIIVAPLGAAALLAGVLALRLRRPKINGRRASGS